MVGGTIATRARLLPRGWLYVLAFAAVAVVFAVRLTQTAHLFGDLWLNDYRLYLQATQRWLAGGDFYPASQLGGPWVIEWQAILYPPAALVLFVPFALMPDGLNTALWLIVPPAVTVIVMLSWKPSVWGWLAIFAILAVDPGTLANYTAGTPTTWFVALAALSTRWRWVSAFILVKPTLLPFALVGVTRQVNFNGPAQRDDRLERSQRLGDRHEVVQRTASDGELGPTAYLRLGTSADVVPRGSSASRASGHEGHGPVFARVARSWVHVPFARQMARVPPIRKRGAESVGGLGRLLGHRRHGRTLDRQWLAGLALVAAGSLVLLPMTLQWLAMMANGRGPLASPLYSIGNFPLMLLPWVAWWTRGPQPRRA